MKLVKIGDTWVNAERVCFVWRADLEYGTSIEFDGGTLRVSQTPDEVAALLMAQRDVKAEEQVHYARKCPSCGWTTVEVGHNPMVCKSCTYVWPGECC